MFMVMVVQGLIFSLMVGTLAAQENKNPITVGCTAMAFCSFITSVALYLK